MRTRSCVPSSLTRPDPAPRMHFVRTPDEQFADLPGLPYAPHYVDVDDFEGAKLRVAHIDEGPRDVQPVLLFHSEPSRSYLHCRL